MKWVTVGRYEIAITYIQGWSKESPVGEGEIPSQSIVMGRPTNGGGLIIGWSAKRDGKPIGFGELTVSDTGEPKFVADTEAMSQEFCEAVFLALARSWADKG